MVGIDFIQDLGLVMLVAAAAGLFCRRFELPLILGYLSAGILIGPHVPFFAMVRDDDRIHALAQIGLVFLVFQLGQGFKLQRFKRVGLPLVLATVIIAILLFNGSRLLGHALGWPWIYGFVLAGMLMVSSSALIRKNLRESNAFYSSFGQTTLTVTALDDLVALVVLALLTVVETSSAAATPGTLAVAAVKLIAVMAAMLIVALLGVPALLRRLERHSAGELRSLFIVGLLLAMALFSSGFGFSAAIGAFLLGSAVASTGARSRVESSIGALCEVFGALFFVAAGMLVDIRVLAEIWPLVLLVSIVALILRGISSSLALLLVGQKSRDAFRASICLTPVGEFSIIIALTAAQAGLVPDWFYALAIGLCLLSAVTTPFLAKRPVEISEWVERRQPEFIQKAAALYHQWVENLQHRQRSSLFWRLTAPRWMQIVIQGLFISGLLLFARSGYKLAGKWLFPDWSPPGLFPVVYWLFFLGLLLGPLIALFRTIEATAMICAEAAAKGKPGRARLQPALETLLRVAASVGVLLWVSMFVPYESLPGWTVPAVGLVLGAAALIFWRKLVRWHSRFEIDLREHLGETASDGRTVTADQWQSNRAQWRLGIREHIVNAQTRAAGRAIHELPLRQMFSCNIIGIERQGFSLANPSADTILYPEDKLLLLGEAAALKEAERWLGAPRQETGQTNGHATGLSELCLDQVVVPQTSRHIGRTLGELKLMQRLGVQVLGIERDGQSRLAVGKLDVLKPGDRLLILGRQQQISEMAFWLDN